MHRGAATVCMVAGFIALAGLQRSAERPFGFSVRTAAAQRDIERRFLSLVDTERIQSAHQFLAAKPHVAGSPRDKELAEWTAGRFRSAGLSDVTTTTHDVLLPWPIDVSVQMVAPRPWRASMKEDPVPGDASTEVPADEIGLPYHAYSASGEVTAEVVYAGSGNPADYDWLASRGIDIRGRIALVRYSVPYSYRGFKALTAQDRGAAGILIYSDPADDGAGKGKVYPEGPWGPLSHIQRGGIVYDFIVPGDPLTPGWASVEGARRIERAQARSLPRIISAPLSAKDARPILEALGGAAVPQTWRGGLPLSYRTGPGPARVKLTVRMDDAIRPIWTVTGTIRGTEQPDELIILGNHRDAWIYGGVDPSSGSAALVELARTVGELTRRGWRPKRSLLFASWDAEEFTLTSSTEWGEQHADRLRANAVAYLNVDSAASGPHLAVSAVPSLNRVITEAAHVVRDPRLRIPIAAAARSREPKERGALPTANGTDLVNNRLGSGSDYTVFLNFLGVPVADLSFDGPYGVYHSLYDTHNWVARIGDPGFRYHAALVGLWGIAALRLAAADALPIDPLPYALRLGEFTSEIERKAVTVRADAQVHAGLRDVRTGIEVLRRAAEDFNRRREAALTTGDAAALATINRQLLQFERAFLSNDGLPDRPWYRHLVYAPKFTYAPELLPGVSEAIDAGNWPGAAQQARQLNAAIRRAATLLTGSRMSPQ